MLVSKANGMEPREHKPVTVIYLSIELFEKTTNTSVKPSLVLFFWFCSFISLLCFCWCIIGALWMAYVNVPIPLVQRTWDTWSCALIYTLSSVFFALSTIVFASHANLKTTMKTSPFDRELTRELVKRAEKAGFSALVLTVDSPRKGRRLDELRHDIRLPPHFR